MSKQITICLKTAWLAGATTVLLMGTGMCISTDATCFEAGDTMLFLMLSLGFPTSLLLIVASQIILNPVIVHSPSDFITAWMLMAFGGFLQWFILVPRFFQKHEFTVLKLETSVTIPLLISRPRRPSLQVSACNRLQSQMRLFSNHPRLRNQKLFNLSVSETECAGNRSSQSPPLTEPAALRSKE